MSTKRGRPASPTSGAEEAVAAVRAMQQGLGLRDQQLADAVKVNQSSVNRALNRHPPILTPTLKKLCNYAETMRLAGGSDRFEETAKRKLADAAADAWDGTPTGMNKLIELLKVVGSMSK